MDTVWEFVATAVALFGLCFFFMSFSGNLSHLFGVAFRVLRGGNG